MKAGKPKNEKREKLKKEEEPNVEQRKRTSRYKLKAQ